MRLIYGYDPLCGWCYGFVPVMNAIAAAHPDLAIDVVPGGLITGARIGPYSAAADYIRGAAENLRATTGRAPSPAFFDMIEGPNSPMSASAPPSHAVLQMAALNADKAAAYAHALQNAHFGRGARYDDPSTYLIDGFPAVDTDAALSATDDTPMVAASFARARALGITSFPTTLLMRGDTVIDTITGVYDPDTMLARLALALR